MKENIVNERRRVIRGRLEARSKDWRSKGWRKSLAMARRVVRLVCAHHGVRPPRVRVGKESKDAMGWIAFGDGIRLTPSLLGMCRRSRWCVRAVAAHEAGHHVAGDTWRGALELAAAAFVMLGGLVVLGSTFGGAATFVVFCALVWQTNATYVRVETRADALGSTRAARIAVKRLRLLSGPPVPPIEEFWHELRETWRRVKRSILDMNGILTTRD